MPTQFKDYYEILGVPRGAAAGEIRSAFRKLARKHHPDVNQGDAAAVEKFKEINEAHEVLGDPEKRRKYDELGPQWEQYERWEQSGKPGGTPFGTPPPGSGPPGPQGNYRPVSPEEMESLFGDRDSPFSDFFHSMFGRRDPGSTPPPRSARRPPAQRGGDVETEVSISLEEAFSSTGRTIELSDRRSTRRVEVRIPAGIADGGLVRAAGQGAPGSDGGAAGDLLIRVRVAPHPAFTRMGDDVAIRVATPLSTALLGGVVAVETPKGTRAELRIPPDTQNGTRLRLRGLGMPKLRGKGHGDLYADIDVRLPVPLTPDQRTAAEGFR